MLANGILAFPVEICQPQRGGGAYPLLPCRPPAFGGNSFFVAVPWEHTACKSLAGDATEARTTWEGHDAINRSADAPVRLVFELKKAKLYFFWIKWDRIDKKVSVPPASIAQS